MPKRAGGRVGLSRPIAAHVAQTLAAKAYEGCMDRQLILSSGQISACGFRKFPDTDFSNSRTRVSVNPGQGFR